VRTKDQRQEPLTPTRTLVQPQLQKIWVFVMMNEMGPRYKCDAEPSRIQALASQLRLTRGDTELVINIVKHNDPPLEWLKDQKVLHIIKQRKGRWVKASVSSFMVERVDGVLSVTH
jgi:hypothetical protein